MAKKRKGPAHSIRVYWPDYQRLVRISRAMGNMDFCHVMGLALAGWETLSADARAKVMAERGDLKRPLTTPSAA